MTSSLILIKKCEKHARKEEALLKLSEGVKFDEVARTYSEDKARQGTFFFCNCDATLLYVAGAVRARPLMISLFLCYRRFFRVED